jgi:hypothetical protein
MTKEDKITSLSEVKTLESSSKCVAMLEEWLEDAKNGRLVTVGLIGRRVNGDWQTSMTSNNRLEDAGMLLELAIRRLGFEVSH